MNLKLNYASVYQVALVRELRIFHYVRSQTLNGDGKGWEAVRLVSQGSAPNAVNYKQSVA